ncbi:MAG: hypothetical protein EAZ47_06110 [Bacteroidetes bacterium]|nr:MAG: hypothetical protein EAY72_04965 [Bacteroidota bacterium]TAF93578.1 MAG: hypothetical protein EAZ47_06110 [Bacteroidota bacterium]
MSTLKDIQPLSTSASAPPSKTEINTKVRELLHAIDEGWLDEIQLLQIKNKIGKFTSHNSPVNQAISAFQTVAEDSSLSRLEKLDSLSALLHEHQLDSKLSKRMQKRIWMKQAIAIIIGITMILLGFGMIVMPAPPYFEMFTLFYLTENDGVTIMDVISLLIILIGIYIIIKTILPRKDED